MKKLYFAFFPFQNLQQLDQLDPSVLVFFTINSSNSDIKMIPKKFLTQLLSILVIFSFFIKQLCSALSIKTPRDLVEFSNNVNNGYKTYEDVVLENDLDMSEYPSFTPIGSANSGILFRGTFDGNGHVISNLNITSKNGEYVGLFGFSIGVTLKNLVLSRTFFVNSIRTDNESPALVGAFMGCCLSGNKRCVFQDLLSFTTLSASGYNYVGGIVGVVDSKSPELNSCIINCLNFGNIEINNNDKGVVGGIVGPAMAASGVVYVQNCANYGDIRYISSSSLICGVGGIIGVTGKNTIVQNCFNVGDFFSDTNAITGGVVGKNEGDVNVKIENCYWLEGTFGDKCLGLNTGKISGDIVIGSSSFSRSYTLNKPVVVDYKTRRELIDALNSFYDISYLYKWMLLDFNCSDTEKVGSLLQYVVHRNLNCLLSMKMDGYMFKGWYLGPDLRKKFNSATNDISRVEKLCGKWAPSINVTFVIEAKKTTKVMANDDNIEYPDIEIEYGYKAEWCTQNKKICNPVESDVDIELYLIQSPKEFTLTFNSNGGTRISPRKVKFSEIIEELPVPEKEGCVFLGWYIDSDFKYPFYLERMLGNDVYLYAKWRDSPGEERTFVWFATLICLAASIAAAWVIFSRRDIIGLKI